MNPKSLLASLICLLGLPPALSAATTAPDTGQGFYVGLTGGWGTTASTRLRQRGAVLLDHARLPIDADGSTGSHTHVSALGLQLGHAWRSRALGETSWQWQPAVELEGLRIGKHAPVGTMPVRPRFLGTQYVTIPMTSTAIMAGTVVTLRSPYSQRLLPYLGLGAGIARTSIEGSDSANPSEPGINHFNSDPDASDSAFALQARVGVSGEVHERLTLFAEYRHLSIAATRYRFGATDYPGEHPPTEEWDVDLGRQKFDLLLLGLRYRFR